MTFARLGMSTVTRFLSILGDPSSAVWSRPPTDGVVPEIDHYRLTAAGVKFLDAWLGVELVVYATDEDLPVGELP